MDFLTLLLLSIGVSMDAFAVSICKGLSSRRHNLTTGGVIAGVWFGGFQALMPIIGYFVGATFHSYITSFDHWIAFFLLAIIGGNMANEAVGEIRAESRARRERKGADECGCCNQIEEQQGGKKECKPYAARKMFPLAIATSIDALAVGISLAMLKVNIWSSALFIGLTTFVFSFAGVRVGGLFGARHKSRAELLGGLILVAIGIRILIEHTLIV